MKNNTEWTISAPQPAHVKFDCSRQQLCYRPRYPILSVRYEKQHKTLANLENLALGKALLDKNKNQEMKQKMQIQVSYLQ